MRTISCAFDFANLEPVSAAELARLEQETLNRIGEGHEVQAVILPLEDARNQGAMMLFGEKYPDPVRMVSIGDFSKELCGGTHVANSSEIGEFEIVSEEAVSAGTRRIVALTGERARENAAATRQTVQRMTELLGTSATGLVSRVDALIARVKALKKQLNAGQPGRLPAVTGGPAPDASGEPAEYREIRDIVRQIARLLNVPSVDAVSRIEALQAEAASLEQQIQDMASTDIVTADELLGRGFDADGVLVIVSEVPGANVNMMRGLIDQVRKKNASAAVFLASIQGPDKVLLLAGLGRQVVERGLSAGEWVKTVAPEVGGRGGGRPDMAQAGGKDPGKLNVGLDAARQFMLTATAT